jgi:hypothetical protein
MTAPAYVGTTDTGAEVFASPRYLDRHDATAAVRHANTATGRIAPDFGSVVAVLLTEYGPRDFGPSGNYWTNRDIVGWFCYPGGMRHGGFYNVVPGAGPAPATDEYPRPTR